ncbi:MAG TPA: gliding motility protein GldM [Bacteroidales bacterium]|nr:gliding motility protein GldM [Bacteroidales bacterium]HPT02650.1 gliding motility protein GldM [Bacteroidales bacterium]
MAGYKETPRQKMIAMMYLVLTAMLALNVSVEILNAFLVVNESMETTNRVFRAKTENLYRQFEIQNMQNPAKVGPYFDKAMKVKKLSQEMRDYVENTKFEAIAFSDGISMDAARTTPLRQLASKDKYDKTTNFFIGNSQDGSKGRSRQLKDKIIKYKQDMLQMIEPAKRNQIKLGLDTDGPYYDASGAKQNWEMYNFYHTILAADVTIMNKIVAEVLNAEQDVVTHLLSEITASDYKFDAVGAAVVPKSQYVFLGENYEAEIFVTAYDTKQTFTANIGGRGVSSTEGVAKISIPATTPGPVSLKGFVNVKSPSGEMQNYPVAVDYIVAPPTLTVSPTKMNVFYAAVDNPVSISAGGVSDAQLQASISNGSITRSGRGWNVRVNETGKAVISVSARMGDRAKSLGAAEFRVKRVPDPTAYIANTSGGPASQQMVLASALIPRMPADFDFDLTFEVTGFTCSGVRRGDFWSRPARGNRLTEEMRDFIRGCKKGDKIWFEDIYAKGPDGTRKLNSIIITLQ